MGTGRPSSTATHALSFTPIDMSESQEKTGVFKRFTDFLTPSSIEPPSQPGSPSRPDRPAKDRRKLRNWFTKSSTILPSPSTSPPHPTPLEENHGAEITLGERSLICSVWTQWLTYLRALNCCLAVWYASNYHLASKRLTRIFRQSRTRDNI